jgi:hypothetical protein
MVALVLVALLGVAFAGCGATASVPSAADPAAIAPAGALAYVELTVRPQGDQRADRPRAALRANDS